MKTLYVIIICQSSVVRLVSAKPMNTKIDATKEIWRYEKRFINGPIMKPKIQNQKIQYKINLP